MGIITKLKRKISHISHPELGTILMLHRVIEQRSEIKINRDIEITPAFLENTILEYRRKGYYFASIKEVEDILSAKKRLKRKFICFTFDDGYCDNFTEAYPIFKKYNCPFTIYVTTELPDCKAILWWYVLDDLIMDNDKLLLNDNTLIECDTTSKKNDVFNYFHKKISNLNSNEIEIEFNKWFSNYKYSFSAKVRELSMTWEQIITLSREELCTIGSHSISHPNLSYLTDEEQENELIVSKFMIENIIKSPVDHFAYPFGAHNSSSIVLAKKCGYHTSVISWGNIIRREDNLHRLNRLFLKEE